MRFLGNILAIAVFAITLGFSSTSHADTKTFKSSEFLTWERDNQAFYFRTSVGMASLIVGQTDKSQGKCLDDWYYEDQKTSSDLILETMQKFPDYHPRGVILAVMEKKCGKFSYRK